MATAVDTEWGFFPGVEYGPRLYRELIAAGDHVIVCYYVKFVVALADYNARTTRLAFLLECTEEGSKLGHALVCYCNNRRHCVCHNLCDGGVSACSITSRNR